jgi:hypothetical protein
MKSENFLTRCFNKIADPTFLRFNTAFTLSGLGLATCLTAEFMKYTNIVSESSPLPWALLKGAVILCGMGAGASLAATLVEGFSSKHQGSNPGTSSMLDYAGARSAVMTAGITMAR